MNRKGTEAKIEHKHNQRAIAARINSGHAAKYPRDLGLWRNRRCRNHFRHRRGGAGADLAARHVIIMGTANLVADDFSMAAANHSGTRAENDDFERIRAMEERHIAFDPEGKRQEIRQIFANKGFKGEDINALVGIITKRGRHWTDVMMAEEHGLALADQSVGGRGRRNIHGVCDMVPCL